MRNYFKGGLKVFANYCIALIIFVVFLYIFISIAKDSYSKWIPLYSSIIFISLFSILYSDLKRLAIKEKRPQYDLKPYSFKGLVLGIIGFSPMIVIELIYPFVTFDNATTNRIIELGLKTMMGPVYFMVRLAGGTVYAYAAASLVVPLVAMLGYMAGFYGFGNRKIINTPTKKNT